MRRTETKTEPERDGASDPEPDLDLVVVGGGPAGLSCGIEAAERGLTCRIFERGGVVESIRHYPTEMTFFSTCERLELGDVPFVSRGPRPTRAEALRYYGRLARHFGLDVRTGRSVTAIEPSGGGFRVHTVAGEAADAGDPSVAGGATVRADADVPEVVRARCVAVATGYYAWPNRVGIPGEDGPFASHYYDEAYRWTGCDVVVAGGGNSAVEAALDLYRNGARVLLVHREAELKPSVKYWVLPDIENRIREGVIEARPRTVVRAIERGVVTLGPASSADEPGGVKGRARDDDRSEDRGNGADGGGDGGAGRRAEAERVRADFTYLLVGHRPDVGLLRGAGATVDGATLEPVFDASTFETDVPGLYVAGSVVSGVRTGAVFIENGRDHARALVGAVARRLGRGRRRGAPGVDAEGVSTPGPTRGPTRGSTR